MAVRIEPTRRGDAPHIAVRLTDDQLAWVKKRAAKWGISFGQVIREAIDLDMATEAETESTPL